MSKPNYIYYFIYNFLRAEDGIRDYNVTGVQTCALPIWHLADAGEGGPEPFGERVEDVPGVLADPDPVLGVLDGSLGGGDRGGLRGVASVAWLVRGHRVGGGQVPAGLLQVLLRPLKGGAHLGVEHHGSAQPVTDLLLGGGERLDELHIGAVAAARVPAPAAARVVGGHTVTEP